MDITKLDKAAVEQALTAGGYPGNDFIDVEYAGMTANSGAHYRVTYLDDDDEEGPEVTGSVFIKQRADGVLVGEF